MVSLGRGAGGLPASWCIRGQQLGVERQGGKQRQPRLCRFPSMQAAKPTHCYGLLLVAEMSRCTGCSWLERYSEAVVRPV